MDAHKSFFDRLRITTYLLQFYSFLARGKFSSEELSKINQQEGESIGRLHLMKNFANWDGDYENVASLIFANEKYLDEAKQKLGFVQVGVDGDIVNYMVANHESFFNRGIQLHELRKLLDVKVFLDRGYLLHDTFNGYVGENMYNFQVDCLDYLGSAAHFYNEGYDYYHKKKIIKNYLEQDLNQFGPYEMKRIQSREEVTFRNFRETYINLILFIESFINSVGYHAFLDGAAKTEVDGLRLRGIQSVTENGWKKYSTLGQRIRNISKIVGVSEIDLSTEPYKSYLEGSVELRNQYVHSSMDKPKPFFSMEDWKRKCDEMIDSKCYELLSAFWKACYSKTSFPKMIFNEFYGSSFKGHQGRYMASE